MYQHLVLAILFCWLNTCLAENPNDTAPVAIFRSRPDLVAPILKPLTHKRDKLAPGFYFVAPYMNEQEGIYIYDNDLNLIYSGFGSAGPGVIHAPQLCTYDNSPHLCFFQGVQMLGWAHGHGVIMNQHYQVVQSIEPHASHQASSDMHEFRVIANGTRVLMTQYLRSVHDLCAYDICDGLGYIQQGAFQEIDIATNRVVFEWRSLEHIPLSESHVPPGTTEISGSGAHPASPWDYFHINSVDKSAQGDYLISARHTSALYKISGVDGRVVWRLGGDGGETSDFRLEGFGFSFQHDARWISDGEGESLVSLFNNGGNGYTQTHPHSDGKIVRVDHKTKTARVLEKIDPPFIDGHAHYAKSQGNLQTLRNGGVVMGWGNDAFFTEYAPLGQAGERREVVFYGYLALRNMMNYRAHKFEGWVGLPLTRPALWTYSRTGGEGDGDGEGDGEKGEMVMYVSWNGATEVREWVFYGARERNGPFMKIRRVKKEGFETLVKVERMWEWTYVEGLDGDGVVLGTSAEQETYVPTERLRELGRCDELACRFVPSEAEREREREETEKAEVAGSQGEVGNGGRRGWIGKRKNQILLGCGLGALLLLVVVVAVVCTDNRVGRSVRGFAGRQLRGKAVIGVAEAEYKPLAADDGEDT